MMKGDVLSGFKTLKVCTSYIYKGAEISHLPFNIEEENVSPVYTEFKGWKEDLTAISDSKNLPNEFNSYVAFIENYLNLPITIVSVGPDRKQTIIR